MNNKKNSKGVIKHVRREESFDPFLDTLSDEEQASVDRVIEAQLPNLHYRDYEAAPTVSLVKRILKLFKK